MRFNKAYFILIICHIVIGINSTFGQDEALDSLLKRLPIESNDSTKAALLAEIGDLYYEIDFDSTVYYYQAALKLSQQIPYYSIELSSWRSLGYVYSYRKNDFAASLDFFRQAVDLSTRHADSVGIAYALSDIGRIYWKQGNSYEALEHHLQVKNIGEQMNNPKVILRAYTSLGIIENENGNNEQAKKYYHEGLLIANALGKDNSKGILYNNLGKAHQDDKEYESAFTYFDKADSIFTGLKDNGWLSLINFNKGKNYSLQNFQEEGIKYYNLALQQNEKIDNKEREVMILSSLAIAYQQLNQAKQSIDIAEKALILLKEIDTNLYYEELYKTLGESYELSGNHQQSHYYFKKYIIFLEEVDKVEETKKIASLIHLYALQKEENKTLSLKALNLEKDKDLALSRSNLKVMSFAFLNLLSFALFWVYSARLRAFKKLDQLKTKLANDLHDNIGTSLNHIKMLSNRMKKEYVVSDKEKDDTISKINIISNELLYNMHDLVWSLDKKKETIGNLLERIQDHADICLGDFNIPYNFSIDLSNQEVLLRTKEKVNTYLIFKESINNILKHTETLKVLISVSKENAAHFKIYISSFYNTKKTEKKLSNQKGIKSMKKRAKELGGEFRVIDNPGNFIVEFSF